MNWMIRLAEQDILKSIKNLGWTEEQLVKDGFDIWKKGNDFFVSSGDWARIPSDDIVKAIKYVYPNANVECDSECGPKDDSWARIF